MRCPNCERDIPADAAFCIHCAAPIAPAPVVQHGPPATGRTIRLDGGEQGGGPVPAQQPAPAPRPAIPARRPRARRHRRRSSPGSALFVVGVIVLLVTKTFWPGILVLIGLMHFVDRGAHGGSIRAWRPLLFFGGLAFLFWTHMLWPGILLLLIGLHLLSSRRYGWRP